MAFSKIAGFDVTPPSPSSSTSRCSSPPEIRLRRMKSSHTDCPYWRSAAIGLVTAEGRVIRLPLCVFFQLRFGRFNYVSRLEAELALQLLERRRRAEGVHADDAARRSDVALPAERGGLLDGDAGPHRGRQHVVAIRRRLFV